MKGDFSRFTFDPGKNYTGVLMQQGRVQLDADWNAQLEMDAYYRRNLAADIIGAFGVPEHDPGFRVLVRQGLEFDGRDDFVYAGKDADLSFVNTRALTIQAWINPSPGNDAGVIAGRFGMFKTLDLPEYVLCIHPGNTLSFLWVENIRGEFYQDIDIYQSEIATVYHSNQVETLSLGFREVRTAASLPSGTFSHVAVTLDTAGVNIYIDGQLAANARTGDFQVPSEGMFLVGAGWNQKRLHHVFNGVIDNMAVWNSSLPATRIREDMHTLLTGKEKGLLRLWHFNRVGSTKEQVRDLSPANKPCILGAGRAENFPNWAPQQLLLGKGRCYNHGILCRNTGELPFVHQPFRPGLEIPGLKEPGTYLFYLDVWRRYLSAIGAPGIREIALGGPDTCGRSQAVWQARYIREAEAEHFFSAMASRGRMNARHLSGKVIRENRLYRVEIHNPGYMASAHPAQDFYPLLEVETVSPGEHETLLTVKEWRGGPESWSTGQYVEVFGLDEGGKSGQVAALITGVDREQKALTLGLPGSGVTGLVKLRVRPAATFKWSADNGSVVFSIAHAAGDTMVLRDPKSLGSQLKVKQWVEVLDDNYVLEQGAKPLVRIASIRHSPVGEITVTFDEAPMYKISMDAHPLLRIWDQGGDLEASGGVVPIIGGQWVSLDEGIEVRFDGGGFYRTGDYWWMPARVDSQGIEWPGGEESSEPRGIEHYYASLARLEVKEGAMEVTADLRKFFRRQTRDNENL